MIAYTLRGVIFFLLALMIVLMVCGVLYIKEQLAVRRAMAELVPCPAK